MTPLPPYRDVTLGLGIISDTFETAITWDRFEALYEGVREKTRRVIREIAGHASASLFFTHKGQLTSEGAFRLDQHTGPFSFAVTGGTGDYAHASGSVSINIVSDMRAQFTLNL